MENQSAIVHFPGITLGDAVVSVGGGAYTGATVGTLPSINSQFFLATGINGEDLLCTTKSTSGPALVLVINNNTPIEAVVAPVTVEVDFIGGRPNDRGKGK